MSSSTTATFGAAYLEAADAAARLALDHAEQRREPFTAADALIARLITTALRGERIATHSGLQDNPRRALGVRALIPLAAPELDTLRDCFDAAAQERRGSWHLPTKHVRIDLGPMHLAHWLARDDRFVLSMAASDHFVTNLRDSGLAVALWAIAPLFEELSIPLTIRSGWGLGRMADDRHSKLWQRCDSLYAALGIDPTPVARFRIGTGWSTHTAETVIGLRRDLIESWATADDLAERYRAYRVGQLIEGYYAKAKNGRATRKQVLVGQTSGRTLTAYFGGDWLAFLAYMGQEPHTKEAVITALPKVRVVGEGARTAEGVAAKHGLAAEDVKQMLAAFWQRSEANSPAEERVAAMKRFWDEFDRHLEALDPDINERPEAIQTRPQYWIRGHRTGANAESSWLSTSLLQEVHRLWGTVVLPRWPDRLVTGLEPHLVSTEAFGVALTFWYFVSSSVRRATSFGYANAQADIAKLEAARQSHVESLASLGAPVDASLFSELRALEQAHRHGREGWYETARDVVTRHRRAWAAEHRDSYLQRRWQSAVRSIAEIYHRTVADRGGKPLTAKQLATLAADTANQWFGGDLTLMCTSFRLPAPMAAPAYRQLLRCDPWALSDAVWDALNQARRPIGPLRWADRATEAVVHRASIDRLAAGAPVYMQVAEASAGNPRAKDVFGTDVRFIPAQFASDSGWARYGTLVQQVHAELLKG